MRRKLRFLLFLFIGISLAGLATALYLNSRLKKDYEESIPRIPEAFISKVQYSGTRNNRREWELEADSAVRSETSNLIILKNVRLVYFMEDGVSYTLRGREGSYNEESGEISIKGGVDVVSDDGYSLKTDSLICLTGSRTVTTKDHVSLSSAMMDITGEGFEMDLDAGRMTVLKDVRTILKDGFRI